MKIYVQPSSRMAFKIDGVEQSRKIVSLEIDINQEPRWGNERQFTRGEPPAFYTQNMSIYVVVGSEKFSAGYNHGMLCEIEATLYVDTLDYDYTIEFKKDGQVTKTERRK